MAGDAGTLPASLALVPSKGDFGHLTQSLREDVKGLLIVDLHGKHLDGSHVTEALPPDDKRLQPKRKKGYGARLTPVACERLIEALQFQTTLRILRITHHNIGNRGVFAIADYLSQNHNLHLLDISHNGITPEGVERLCEGLALNESLKSLDLGWNDIRDVGSLHLAKALIRNTTLTELKMESSKATGRGAVAIANVLAKNLCGLTHVDLRKHRVTIEHASIVGEAISHSTTLEVLQFGPFHSVPVQEVVGRTTAEFHTLDLSRFGYGPHDLSLISGIIYNNSRLTGLDLRDNPITRQPTSLVLRDVPVPPYQELTGYDPPELNDVADAVHAKVDINLLPPEPAMKYGLATDSRQEGILMLARNMANMPVNNIKFLDLQGCGVDCAGARHLATHLLQNTVLETLVLGEVPLPIQKIKGRIPTPSLDVRPNALRRPLDVFIPEDNQNNTVGLPDPTPDDVIMGWLVPYNTHTSELNGLSFRGVRRYENWRRSLAPYELRWYSAWLSITDRLITLNLSGTYIGPSGAIVLAGGLATNVSIQRLFMAQTGLAGVGTSAITRAVTGHPELRELDLSFNIGAVDEGWRKRDDMDAVQALVDAAEAKKAQSEAKYRSKLKARAERKKNKYKDKGKKKDDKKARSATPAKKKGGKADGKGKKARSASPTKKSKGKGKGKGKKKAGPGGGKGAELPPMEDAAAKFGVYPPVRRFKYRDAPRLEEGVTEERERAITALTEALVGVPGRWINFKPYTGPTKEEKLKGRRQHQRAMRQQVALGKVAQAKAVEAPPPEPAALEATGGGEVAAGAGAPAAGAGGRGRRKAAEVVEVHPADDPATFALSPYLPPNHPPDIIWMTLPVVRLKRKPLPSKLQTLTLAHNGITDEELMRMVDGMAAATALTELNLRNNKFGDDGVCHLAHVLMEPDPPPLRKLDLCGHSLGKRGFRRLGKALQTLSTITSLDISWGVPAFLDWAMRPAADLSHPRVDLSLPDGDNFIGLWKQFALGVTSVASAADFVEARKERDAAKREKALKEAAKAKGGGKGGGKGRGKGGRGKARGRSTSRKKKGGGRSKSKGSTATDVSEGGPLPAPSSRKRFRHRNGSTSGLSCDTNAYWWTEYDDFISDEESKREAEVLAARGGALEAKADDGEGEGALVVAAASPPAVPGGGPAPTAVGDVARKGTFIGIKVPGAASFGLPGRFGIPPPHVPRKVLKKRGLLGGKKKGKAAAGRGAGGDSSPSPTRKGKGRGRSRPKKDPLAHLNAFERRKQLIAMRRRDNRVKRLLRKRGDANTAGVTHIGRCVARLVRNSNITTLKLRNALMRVPDLARISIELYKHPHLTYLDLSMEVPPHGKMGDSGPTKPAFDYRGAQGVARNFIGIGPNGMEALSVWLCQTRVLQKLSLRGAVIGDEGARIFTRCLQVNVVLGETLCFLDLTNNNITYGGARELVKQLAKEPSQTVLTLFDNLIKEDKQKEKLDKLAGTIVRLEV